MSDHLHRFGHCSEALEEGNTNARAKQEDGGVGMGTEQAVGKASQQDATGDRQDNQPAERGQVGDVTPQGGLALSCLRGDVGGRAGGYRPAFGRRG